MKRKILSLAFVVIIHLVLDSAGVVGFFISQFKRKKKTSTGPCCFIAQEEGTTFLKCFGKRVTSGES